MTRNSLKMSHEAKMAEAIRTADFVPPFTDFEQRNNLSQMPTGGAFFANQ